MKYNPEHIDLMKEQIWEAKLDISVYEQLCEYEQDQISKYLPRDPKFVMDFGGGLGRGIITLNNHYKNPDIVYVLADRDGRTNNTGAYAPREDQYYNNFELARSFCKMNSVCPFMFDTEKDPWDMFYDRFDLITSRCSLGMHVPIERYMDRLLSIASPDCVMIFGTRCKIDRAYFEKRFETVVFDRKPRILPFPLQNWLILKNPRKGP